MIPSRPGCVSPRRKFALLPEDTYEVAIDKLEDKESRSFENPEETCEGRVIPVGECEGRRARLYRHHLGRIESLNNRGPDVRYNGPV